MRPLLNMHSDKVTQGLITYYTFQALVHVHVHVPVICAEWLT